MSPILLFPSIFFGILFLGWLLYLFANGFYRPCKSVERKTGSSALAYSGMPLLLFAFFFAGYLTWLVSVVNASKPAGTR